MEYKSLTQQEQDILRILLNKGRITAEDLPLGIWISLDSMGPIRDSETDTFYRGMGRLLFDFGDILMQHNLAILVATNGPDKEGEEILTALEHDDSVAVTEGGGKILYLKNGELKEKVLASPQGVNSLVTLEERVKQNNVMKAMIENREADEHDAPIRTPYDTAIVLTLPTRYETLQGRLEAQGIQVDKYVSGVNSNNYINRLLDYSRAEFAKAMEELGIRLIKDPLIKSQNRRIYVSPKYLVDGQPLDKATGAILGTEILRDERSSPLYTVRYSAYVADKLVDVTGEGNLELSKSERSMVLNNGQRSRLGINVSMDNQLPKLVFVEGVKILYIDSGAKALEAIDFFYKALHPVVNH